MTDRRIPLAELEAGVPFARRHIGPDAEAQAKMLAQVGYGSLDELTDAAVPGRHQERRCARSARRPHRGRGASPSCARWPTATRCWRPMIGLGYYGTFTPPVILRNVMENPAWYTAYTPYQPEISQGRLEALLNFQTMVADLTGLPTSGASLLDEGTAAAEAMALSRRVGKVKDGVFLVDADTFPQTVAVIRTRAEPTGVEVVVADLADGIPAEVAERGVFGVLLQYPGASGAVRDLRPVIEQRPRTGRGRHRRRRPARPDPAHLAGRARRRHRGRHHPALRRAHGLRRPARRLHGRPRLATPAACPAAWSASPSTPTATRRTGWRCRPASSTSAARRPPATSAPRRCCSP